MFSSRNLVFGVALLAITWAGFVIGSRYYISQRITAAQDMLDHGKYDQAIDILAAADRFQPDNPNVQYHLAVAYRRNNERDNFFAHLDHAEEIGFSSAPRLNMQKMLFQAQSGVNVGEIATEFNNAPDDITTPDFVDQVCEAVAKGHLINSEFQEAESALQVWLSHRKDAVIAHILLANIDQRLTNFDGAASHYEEAIELDPYNVDAVCEFVAMIDVSERASEQSREFVANSLDRCLEENAHNARLLLAASEHAYKLGEYERAEKLAGQALEAFPNHDIKGASNLLMGKLKLNSGEYDEAIRFLNNSIALNPLTAEPYSLLALAYRSTNNNELADQMTRKSDEMKAVSDKIQSLTTELSTDPTSIDKMLEMANLLYANDHSERAAKWWLSVLRVDSKNKTAIKKLILFYRGQGRDDLAESYEDSLKQIDSNDAQASNGPETTNN